MLKRTVDGERKVMGKEKKFTYLLAIAKIITTFYLVWVPASIVFFIIGYLLEQKVYMIIASVPWVIVGVVFVIIIFAALLHDIWTDDATGW